jgi:hypothetical protein
MHRTCRARSPGSSAANVSPASPTVSGSAAARAATTGVPQASASMITRPNGSGQSMGKSSAAALPRNSSFSCSSISPTYSTSG